MFIQQQRIRLRLHHHRVRVERPRHRTHAVRNALRRLQKTLLRRVPVHARPEVEHDDVLAQIHHGRRELATQSDHSKVSHRHQPRLWRLRHRVQHAGVDLPRVPPCRVSREVHLFVVAARGADDAMGLDHQPLFCEHRLCHVLDVRDAHGEQVRHWHRLSHHHLEQRLRVGLVWVGGILPGGQLGVGREGAEHVRAEKEVALEQLLVLARGRSRELVNVAHQHVTALGRQVRLAERKAADLQRPVHVIRAPADAQLVHQ
mmetsp:Transcript_16473/g.52436  ORF Transcript_16473/g.52436 Transcript_16473/m.52436 type:complete len:259 (-) Transcript_16473:395-1171(-)